MILQLSEEEVMKVCKECSSFNGAACTATTPEKPIKQVRRCEKWDTFYGEKCVRKP